jgi:hypothetical protein
MKSNFCKAIGQITAACVALLAVPATAQVNYAVSGGTAYVTSSPNAAGNVVIASTYSGFPVTVIENSAFSGCTNLTSVMIPNSVTNIGQYAFAHSTSLASVTIPNSVTIIGDRAFYYCASLTSATIPNGVTRIGVSMFYECTSLVSVTIPNSVTNITNWAFFGCTSLASVTIPDSITSLGEEAFRGCDALTSVTIPNSVTGIGIRAFSSCANLTSITVAADNPAFSSIGGVLFNKAQTTLIQFPGGYGGSYAIPNGVTSIAYGAFRYHTSLTHVTVPNSVTAIADWAFASCTSLTSVMIGNSLTNIGGFAFYFCTNLTSFTFGGNAPSAGSYMFFSVGPGATVYYYYGTTGWGATYGGLPTVMLYPPPQVGTGSAGVKPGGFGFTINGVVNQTIVVEASTNLANWQPIWTNTLSAVSTNFVDSQWLNHSRRFYRLRSN